MKLTIKFDATNDIWFAFDGADEAASSYLGQGSTPENACSDYWYQAHGDSAELVRTDDDCWALCQGSWQIEFLSKQAAVDWANANNWQVKGKV